MSGEEFIDWVAYLRQNPAPTGVWLNRRFAELMREVHKGNTKKWARLDEFMWKPPEPMFVTREKEKARRTKARKEKKP